jgi:hypothetical protein
MLHFKPIAVALTALTLGGIGAVAVAMASGGGGVHASAKGAPVIVVVGSRHNEDTDLERESHETETITSTTTLTLSKEVDDSKENDDHDVELESDMTGTVTSTHSLKVAISIANFFSVPVTSVVELHGSGWGYGEIFKLYELARISGKSPDEIQAMRASGLGWGQIAKALNVKLGGGEDHVTLGGVISGHDEISGTQIIQNDRRKTQKPQKSRANSDSVIVNPHGNQNSGNQSNQGNHGNTRKSDHGSGHPNGGGQDHSGSKKKP